MDEALIGDLRGARAVLVASTGGHLAQLHRIVPQLGLAEDPLWITFESDQSRSLLRGQRVVYIPYIAPRDVGGVIRATRLTRAFLKNEDFDVALSTGAAAALPVLPRVLVNGKRVIYIESVSRFKGPSLTGRIMSLFPGAELYTQHASWAGRRWKYAFSVLDDFVARKVNPASGRPIRVFVTLGTIKPYRFDRLIERVLRIAPHADVRWQLGETVRDDLPGTAKRYMSTEAFEREIEWADVIITHAGVGTALNLLDLGAFPILVPRRAKFAEHVDDHQAQISTYLQEKGLGLAREVEDLEVDDLLLASTRRIERSWTE